MSNKYPHDSDLERIGAWDHRDCKGLLAFVRSLWWMSDWGWQQNEEGTLYKISTGGWSGNESLVDAMNANRMFWSRCWQGSWRGGYYEFEVEQFEEPEGTNAEATEVPSAPR